MSVRLFPKVEGGGKSNIFAPEAYRPTSSSTGRHDRSTRIFSKRPARWYQKGRGRPRSGTEAALTRVPGRSVPPAAGDRLSIGRLMLASQSLHSNRNPECPAETKDRKE